jgi:hypothetical protein
VIWTQGIPVWKIHRAPICDKKNDTTARV